jgi:formylglycine-generating enzyme required for sulfatase activity
VLELLRSRGLLVRVRGDGEPSWELIHDSLVPRVLAWVDRRDLARRRAIELVRYHVRRSRADAPSLLDRDELRELKPHTAALDDLDIEWRKTHPASAPEDWTPARLVARSHSVLRRRALAFGSALFVALAIASIGMYRWYVDKQSALHEAELKALDIGRFTIVLELFDWDPAAQRAISVPVTKNTGLKWVLHVSDTADNDQPGAVYASDWLVRGSPRVENGALVEEVEAHGGAAFIVISRGPCAASTIPLPQVPGYAQRDSKQVLRLFVPTCQVTGADTIELVGGSVYYGGPGIPPSPMMEKIPESDPAEAYTEARVHVPTFRLDRTEVTNAAFEVFVRMSNATRIERPQYPDTPELKDGGAPRKPVTQVNWIEARAYCRFLGKELPTSQQWTRALRGRIESTDEPRKNFPWGTTNDPTNAKVRGTQPPGPAVVASFPRDRTDEGIFDLAGNVTEWTSTGLEVEGQRVVRGSNWDDDVAYFVDFMAIENPRPMRVRNYTIGVRCASSP